MSLSSFVYTKTERAAYLNIPFYGSVYELIISHLKKKKKKKKTFQQLVK